MAFLAPLFLLGLATLAVPILIHLVQREHRNLVEFPSLMFLQRIPYESVKRRRIRNWLLLAVRLAALALIVAAFARPFLQRPQLAAAAATGAREVVVLIDASYSMGYGDRWTQARAAAQRVIEGLGGDDRASIVLFASQPEVAIRATADRARLLAALDLASLSAGTTRYGAALKLGGSILAESALPRRELVLISDFQRAGWTDERIAAPQGTVLTPIAVGDENDTTNASVTPVSLERSNFTDQERVAITAGLINRGPTPLTNVPVTLEFDGHVIGTQQVSAGPGASGSVSFAPVTIAHANSRGTIRIPADALAADNTFNFVVSPSAPLKVALIGRDGAPSAANLYLTRAFSIGDAPRFEATLQRASELVSNAAIRANVVVLNDVAVNGPMAASLNRFVVDGGGLIVIAGDHAEWPAADGLLPVRLGERVDRTVRDVARLGYTDFGHPVFDLFRTPRSGEFSTARFYGYRALNPGNRTDAEAEARILARFDDGSPALVEGRLGRGRVLVWSSTLDPSWTDLVLKPVFLPFVHQLARHVSGYTEPEPWLTVGQVLEPPPVVSGSPQTILAPSGRRVEVDDEGTGAVQLVEAGFYEIRAAARSNAPVTTIASNVDLAESDLARLDPAAPAAALAGSDSAVGVAVTEEPSVEAREQAQRLWWYLLFGGVLLLGVETWLARRVVLKA